MKPDSLPPYSYVPGQGWPHPISHPQGHSHGIRDIPEPIEEPQWANSYAYLRGFTLFANGFYWEAHEAWEGLWHAHKRRGPTADLLKGLIKLAAAGVKLRQGQRHGVVTHARRAAEVFEASRREGGNRQLGIDLEELIQIAREIASNPPLMGRNARFAFQIEPRESGTSA